jgi:hypothetical protein
LRLAEAHTVSVAALTDELRRSEAPLPGPVEPKRDFVARRHCCTATSAYNWRSGKTTPRIDQLLQLSDRLRIPIATFLLAGRAPGLQIGRW